MFDERAQFDLHPFIGQNWHNSDSYWGTEIGMNFRSDAISKPWAKISVRFSNGDNSIMDGNRGFDMHSEIRFSEHFGLDAGTSKDGSNDMGQYVMLRWKLVGD
jgi:hypothetical protein